MADTTITMSDIDGLAAKLEGMSEQFSASEQATLHALFSLAGRGVEASDEGVSGFAAFSAFTPIFQVTVAGTNGTLIGLNKSFGGARGAVHRDSLDPVSDGGSDR